MFCPTVPIAGTFCATAPTCVHNLCINPASSICDFAIELRTILSTPARTQSGRTQLQQQVDLLIAYSDRNTHGFLPDSCTEQSFPYLARHHTLQPHHQGIISIFVHARYFCILHDNAVFTINSTLNFREKCGLKILDAIQRILEFKLPIKVGPYVCFHRFNFCNNYLCLLCPNVSLSSRILLASVPTSEAAAGINIATHMASTRDKRYCSLFHNFLLSL